MKKSFTSVITLQFNTTMDPTSAGLPSNYQLSAKTAKGKKKKSTVLTRLTPSVVFVQSTNTVTLTVTSKKNPFATGGQLVIVAAPPGGVHSQANVYLERGLTFLHNLVERSVDHIRLSRL